MANLYPSMSPDRICLTICGQNQAAKNAISRSYSPKTLELLQRLDAVTYNPKVVQGCVYIGGAKRDQVDQKFLSELETNGFKASEISCRCISLENRELMAKCGVINNVHA